MSILMQVTIFKLFLLDVQVILEQVLISTCALLGSIKSTIYLYTPACSTCLIYTSTSYVVSMWSTRLNILVYTPVRRSSSRSDTFEHIIVSLTNIWCIVWVGWCSYGRGCRTLLHRNVYITVCLSSLSRPVPGIALWCGLTNLNILLGI